MRRGNEIFLDDIYLEGIFDVITSPVKAITGVASKALGTVGKTVGGAIGGKAGARMGGSIGKTIGGAASLPLSFAAGGSFGGAPATLGLAKRLLPGALSAVGKVGTSFGGQTRGRISATPKTSMRISTPGAAVLEPQITKMCSDISEKIYSKLDPRLTEIEKLVKLQALQREATNEHRTIMQRDKFRKQVLSGLSKKQHCRAYRR